MILGKCLIFSAPSGSGKTTIVHHLLDQDLKLEFSVSASSRKPRTGEINGKDYYFLSLAQFKEKIERSEFLEWEEVYEGQLYGTMRSEIERIWNKGNHVIFDVDVKGGMNLKKVFGERALSIFIKPPSIEELSKRLHVRSTDNEAEIQRRLAKAQEEMKYAPLFDIQIENNILEDTQAKATRIVSNFVKSK